MSDYERDAGSGGDPMGPSLGPDQPISALSEDYLDRGTFASRLANQLRSYTDARCLVVALYAPWGAGKSSLLNLLADDLSKETNAEAESPIVIRFNPWNFSNMDSLLSMFFRELQIGIGTSGSTLSENVRRSLRALSVALAVGQLSPIAGSSFGAGSQLAMQGADLLGDDDQSLPAIKRRTNDALLKFGRRVSVLIDDIDRLDQESMRLMFRLIRLNADFDRMTYVLAFDKTVVASVLTQEQGTSGYDYLEKFVQVGFDIPPAEPSKLQGALSQALSDLGFWTSLDQESDLRWLGLKAGALDKLISTPRDVVRYTNSLVINGGIVVREVNPVDFAGIEALRTFAPKVHEFIRDNRDLAIGMDVALMVDTEATQQERRDKLDQLYLSCKVELRPHIKELCR